MSLTPSTMLPLGTTMPDFRLPNANDAVGDADVGRDDLAGQPVVVVFTCNHCPYAVHVEPRLIDLARDWWADGVAVVAISSNDADAYPQDGPDAMADRAARLGYPFPYLYDESQSVAQAFDAACTPDFYLFDRDHRLVYRGRLDDGRPGTSPTTTDLSDAVADLLATGRVADEQIPSMGCNIKWK